MNTRKGQLRNILEDNFIYPTDEELDELLSGPIPEESERRGWIDLKDFRPYELVDMLDRLRFSRMGS